MVFLFDPQMDMLIRVILGEIVVALAVIIVLLILLVWWLLRKIVVVPAISVATDKDAYFRSEEAAISGALLSNGNPIPNQPVALAIKPPTGDAYSLPSVTTDADGAFTSSWVVPEDAVAGSYVLTAAALGVKATKTFTLSPSLEELSIEPPPKV